MKDLLIIFIVLLVLLLIISTLGGSIKINEKFESQTMKTASSLVPFVPPVSSILKEASHESEKSQHFIDAEQEEDYAFEGFDGNDCYATLA